jgi:hypothetical protein
MPLAWRPRSQGLYGVDVRIVVSAISQIDPFMSFIGIPPEQRLIF